MKQREYRGFEQDLVETFEGYTGIHHDLLRISPQYFRLFCKILQDRRVSWESRLLVDAALAYFVVPQDVFPDDKFGEIGYIDDVFVCAYVVSELLAKGLEPVVRDCWEGEIDIVATSAEYLERTRKLVSGREDEILDFVGLKGLKESGF